jgi:ribonuclease HI
MLRRFVQRRPDLHAMLRNCWEAYGNNAVAAPGPIGIVAKVLASLGWTWYDFDSFERPGRSALPLADGPEAWWLHEVRDGLRLARWAAAASRQDMKGLDALQGIDRHATMSLLNSGANAEEVGMLRRILSGSIRLQKRLHDADLVDSPLCPFCGLVDESDQHCFWDCRCWSHVRNQFLLPPASVFAQWPVCTKTCGLFLEDACVLDLSLQLEQEAATSHNLAQHFGCGEARDSVMSLHEDAAKQVVWTDGASSRNQDHRFRRAGSGIFYGEEHPMNLSVIVPGLLQSNQRAELLAVVLCCLRDPRPLDIRSDSEYVCKGAASWRCWCGDGWRHDHADLWNMLADELRTRATAVNVSWVKGHAKRVDIERGRTTEEDKWGNDGADALAVAGAAMHEVSAEVVAAARQRKEYARTVQRMMVSILQARFTAEETHNDAAEADRGSEVGSDTELLHVSGTEPTCAWACNEFELLDLYVSGTANVFDDFAQVDSPEDTCDVEGLPNDMHEHVVQTNSLDDEFDVGLD